MKDVETILLGSSSKDLRRERFYKRCPMIVKLNRDAVFSYGGTQKEDGSEE